MLVLVTGGCGFVGSHLCEVLLERGHEVRVIGLRCDQGNIRSFEDDISFVRADVRNYDELAKAVDEEIDAIFHLSALINVDESRNLPLEFLKTNILGSVNLLEHARLNGIEQLVYMSTCEVYGDIPTGRAAEDHPTEPKSPYAASKFAAERYALSYAHTYPAGPKIKIVRGFNQYGPRQNSGRTGAVVARFARRLAEGEPLTVFGTGEQTRDYVFVKDTVLALARVLEARMPSGDIINLGTGKETSIRDLARIMCELEGVEPERNILFVPGRPGELVRSCGDWSKASKVLGWRPETSLKEGLKRTLLWYRDRLVLPQT